MLFDSLIFSFVVILSEACQVFLLNEMRESFTRVNILVNLHEDFLGISHIWSWNLTWSLLTLLIVEICLGASFAVCKHLWVHLYECLSISWSSCQVLEIRAVNLGLIRHVCFIVGLPYLRERVQACNLGVWCDVKIFAIRVSFLWLKHHLLRPHQSSFVVTDLSVVLHWGHNRRVVLQPVLRNLTLDAFRGLRSTANDFRVVAALLVLLALRHSSKRALEVLRVYFQVIIAVLIQEGSDCRPFHLLTLGVSQ